MRILAFLSVLLLLWPMAALARRGWRLFAALLFVALVTGCAGTSNKFETSPCACDFKPLNTGNFGGKTNA